MNRTLLFITALYLLFVIYGSLVPLEFKDIPLETAISQFKHIRYLALGAASRADWIANIVLYIPLAFAASATFGGVRHPLARVLLSVAVLVFCLALAVAVEFAQLFFPPRTVSLNDLIAETLGTVIGVLGWQFWGAYFSGLYRHLLRGSLLSAQAAIIFYLLVYVALSLFPFDFVTSQTELNEKLANGNDAVFLPFDACGAEPLRCGVKLLAEMLAVLPLGLLFCYLPYLQHRIIVAVLVGFFLSVVIEAVQVFLLSGSGQGISVLTRMVGMGAGAGLFVWAKRHDFADMKRLLRRVVWFTLLPYLFLVLSINGWFAADWSTSGQALEKLATTRFLPLYYFYYTSEGVALVSLLSNLGLYFPVGLLCWAVFFSADHKRRVPHWFYVGLLAALFALVVEAGKLFLADKHADPSDVWLAFFAAAGCYAFMNGLLRWLVRDKTRVSLNPPYPPFPKGGKSPPLASIDRHNSIATNVNPAPPFEKPGGRDNDYASRLTTDGDPVPPFEKPGGRDNDYASRLTTDGNPVPPFEKGGLGGIFSNSKHEADKKWRIVSFLLWGVIAAALSDYPVAAAWLGLFLIGYTALLLRFPYLWLIVIPALLPIMDFAPWTGRFFFDEFDLTVLATLAFYCWQKPKGRTHSLLSMPTIVLLAAFTLLYAVSLFNGLSPLPELNANAFNNYYSNFNSLRVGKGYIWSLLLLPLLQLTLRRYRYAPRYFGFGVLLGLTGVAVFAIIERLVFASLFDFSSDYRINALFSTMHAGGGHIESYLMLGLPFITLLFVKPTHRLISGLLGIILFVIGLYTLLVTFSRGGYIGFGVGFVVLLLALLVCFRKHTDVTKRSLLILPLLAISIVMALPVLRGGMVQHRFSVAGQDRDSRAYHWHDALAMRDGDISTSLFGMGLGSYPRTFFWLNTENTHPATYEIANENGNNYLRLRGGDSLFMGQYLAIEPHTAYRLVLDVRGETGGAALSTSLCEKSVQYSLRCSTVVTATGNRDWKHVGQAINSNAVGERVAGGLLKRPIQLAFYNGNGAGKLLDVDNVQLLDTKGVNILANGDFTQGGDFWFFAAEKHNPWHIFNFWVHLLFDQGWLGAIVFFLLFADAIYTLCRRLPQQCVFAVVLLSAFSGFMVVGFVDSPFDAPRLTLLFFLLLFFALMRTPRAWERCKMWERL